MNRTIKVWPAQVLKKQCQPVMKFDEETLSLAKDLIDTCNVKMGRGLAAPQIGISKRMVVLN